MSPSAIAKKAQAKEIILENGEDALPNSDEAFIDLHLSDARGFEDRLMNRVKEALRAIID